MRQQDFYQTGAQSQGEPQGQPGSPSSIQSDKNRASHITQKELMDTQSTNASARNEFNITEPDPDILKSCMDDVFGGSVPTDPENAAESISSIEVYQDVTSEAQASKAWADAKEDADIKAGIKSCCSVSVLHLQVGKQIRGEFLTVRTASWVRFPLRKIKVSKSLGRTSIR